MNGKVIIFSAPSGSGKSTIVNHLLGLHPEFEFSISATSRKPRGGEKDGVEYYFFSAEEFRNLVGKDSFVEYEEVYEDRFYGTLKSEVERIWAKNHVIIFDVDVKGGTNLKKYFGDKALSVLIKAPSIDVLRERLEKRGTDSPEAIEERVNKAAWELEFAQGKFDYELVNDNLETAFAEIEKVTDSFLGRRKILVTGAAGFIGFHLTRKLLECGDVVVGLDNLNDYYPVELKTARLRELDNNPSFRFIKGDISDREALPRLFESEGFDAVVNLAAQAGVRYSIENPFAYVDSNLVGFVNILECCRHYPVSHLVYASSSSVYGGNEKVPFSEDDKVDNPVSLYAATKKADELMASCYSKLYGIPSTGLRFFTVYGPWGRPDMAPMLFASAISEGRPIKVFNGGDMMRDFTYIDDIVEGIIRVLDSAPAADSDSRRHSVYNIGCSNPVRLMDFISEMEDALGIEALKQMLPMQPGDVYQTYADTSKLERDFGYKPSATLHDGIREFVKWYKSGKNPLR